MDEDKTRNVESAEDTVHPVSEVLTHLDYIVNDQTFQNIDKT